MLFKMNFFKDYVVIEFGAHYIKVVCAKKKNGRIIVSKAGLLPTPESAVINGTIESPDAVAAVLCDYIKSEGLKNKDAIVTIASSNVAIREINVPSADPMTIKGVISLEAQEYFPMNLDECVIDYKVMSREQEEGRTLYKVMLVAVPNQIITDYVSVVENAGLNVLSIDLSSDCINKLYGKYSMPPHSRVPDRDGMVSTTAFLDIGATITNVTIATNDVFNYSKIIPVGAGGITEALAEAYGISKSEAEALKAGYSLPEDGNARDLYDERVAASLADLFEHLSIFFDFHTTRKHGNTIDEIILVGGGAYLKNLDKTIRRVFNVPVFKGFMLDGIEFQKSAGDIEPQMLYFYNCLGALVNL